MNKSYILLRMYDALRSGAGVKITDCCGRYEISVATFRRYIAFLRGYVAEVCGREIVYDPGSAVYILK
ncbi:MAG TPA: hypothetical protein H9708_02210 [Candidatus Borkfalkia stercoripullorum]|nr:hypothetical protein [Candidatus Borkfalkia stercoripullorum]